MAPERRQTAWVELGLAMGVLKSNFHWGSMGGVAGVGYQVLPQLAVDMRYAAGLTKLR